MVILGKYPSKNALSDHSIAVVIMHVWRSLLFQMDDGAVCATNPLCYLYVSVCVCLKKK